MDLRAVRDVNNGFGDGLAAAFEMVVTPLIFGFLGYLVDRWLGTHLVFALGFGLFTFGYLVLQAGGALLDRDGGPRRQGALGPPPAAAAACHTRVAPMFEQIDLDLRRGLTRGRDRDRHGAPGPARGAADLVLVCGLIWGVDGALSSAYGVALVLVNFLLAAALLAWAARISPTMLMAATLGGFLLRMVLIVVAVSLVHHASWAVMVPLLFTILVTHVGLLIWETRYVSALAGLSRPQAPQRSLTGDPRPRIRARQPTRRVEDALRQRTVRPDTRHGPDPAVGHHHHHLLRRGRAARRRLVPKGAQNVAESAVDFIQDGIILQTMGEEGLSWTTFMLTMFSFILVLNMWEVMPGFQMPVTAHIAIPVELAMLVWFLFNAVGIKSQGFFGYFKSMAFPPLGVPLAVFHYLLITPIEIISTLFVRPLSLAVRLFANMLAGHLLLATFAVLSAGIFFGAPSVLKIGAVLPFGLLVALTGFEVLVAFLQAFIFTILAAVYIGGAMHPEH